MGSGLQLLAVLKSLTESPPWTKSPHPFFVQRVLRMFTSRPPQTTFSQMQIYAPHIPLLVHNIDFTLTLVPPYDPGGIVPLSLYRKRPPTAEKD